MKDLTGIELNKVISEIDLAEALLNKIYQPYPRTLVLKFRSKSRGKIYKTMLFNGASPSN
jgi:predicted ribosome quality control (RQC) complex YloA/Tae2 family protein